MNLMHSSDSVFLIFGFLYFVNCGNPRLNHRFNNIAMRIANDMEGMKLYEKNDRENDKLYFRAGVKAVCGSGMNTSFEFSFKTNDKDVEKVNFELPKEEVPVAGVLNVDGAICLKGMKLPNLEEAVMGMFRELAEDFPNFDFSEEFKRKARGYNQSRSSHGF